MAVLISRSILDAILALAAADPLREICGLLLGEGEGVRAFRPAKNVAPDPARHFEIDPAMLIAAHRDARSGGPAILGYYHSHPSGTTRPSRKDAAQAQPDGMLWLIAAQGGVAAWRSGQGGLHGRFTAESLVPVAQATLASPAHARQ